MPTMLKRTHVTHTPPVREALRVARHYWPESASSDSALLTLLAIKGARDIESEELTRAERLAKTAAKLDAAFGRQYTDHYLEELRAGWPS